MQANKIYNEDCLVTMARMPNDYIDMTVTSPPYDELRTYKNDIHKSWGEHVWKPIIQELYRVTKQGGVVVWVVNDMIKDGSETGTSFKQALFAKECGFNLHDTMIYMKAGIAFPDTVRYYSSFEYMFVFSKGRPKTINLIADRVNITAGKITSGSDRCKDGSFKTRTGARKGKVYPEIGIRYNTWQVPHAQRNEHTKGHPATFPLAIPRDHIITWSSECDLIYDPFIGSGTTAKAALQLGRQYIGSELSKEYADLATQILENEEAKIKSRLF